MNIKTPASILALATSLVIGLPAIAGSHGDQAHGSHMMDQKDMGNHAGHMKDQKAMGSHSGHMNTEMREVMAQGRVNKVMAGHGMVNINHEPIPEMSWPKMNMNFKTQPQVKLDGIEAGQQVKFKLLVDSDNNYVIKEIIAE